jgi:hypothetical protein
VDNPSGYRLPRPEDIRRHCGHRNIPVSVMDIVDVGDVNNIGDVSDVSDVGDVHLTQIAFSMVVPGKERFAGPEWKPRLYAEANADRKPASAQESDKRRSIDGQHSYRPWYPPPD